MSNVKLLVFGKFSRRPSKRLSDANATLKSRNKCEGVQTSNGEISATLSTGTPIEQSKYSNLFSKISGRNCKNDGILCIETEIGTFRVFFSNAFMHASVLLFTCVIRPSAIAKLLLCLFFLAVTLTSKLVVVGLDSSSTWFSLFVVPPTCAGAAPVHRQLFLLLSASHAVLFSCNVSSLTLFARTTTCDETLFALAHLPPDTTRALLPFAAAWFTVDVFFFVMSSADFPPPFILKTF